VAGGEVRISRAGSESAVTGRATRSAALAPRIEKTPPGPRAQPEPGPSSEQRSAPPWGPACPPTAHQAPHTPARQGPHARALPSHAPAESHRPGPIARLACMPGPVSKTRRSPARPEIHWISLPYSLAIWGSKGRRVTLFEFPHLRN